MAKDVTDAARRGQRDGSLLNRVGTRKRAETLHRAVCSLAGIVGDVVVIESPVCRNVLRTRGA